MKEGLVLGERPLWDREKEGKSVEKACPKTYND